MAIFFPAIRIKALFTTCFLRSFYFLFFRALWWRPCSSIYQVRLLHMYCRASMISISRFLLYCRTFVFKSYRTTYSTSYHTSYCTSYAYICSEWQGRLRGYCVPIYLREVHHILFFDFTLQFNFIVFFYIVKRDIHNLRCDSVDFSLYTIITHCSCHYHVSFFAIITIVSFHVFLATRILRCAL